MSRRPTCALLVSGIIALAAACGEPGSNDARPLEAPERSAVPDEQAVASARAAANGLGQELQAKLFAALDSAGPAQAVSYCADSAQTWTAQHAKEGVYVRRVSMRVRNPQNRPDATESVQLARLDSLHRAGALPGEVMESIVDPSGARVVAYLRPVIVQERCLACHGTRERISPEVRSLLAERYPEDRATGYAAGDFRGMVSVRVRP